MARVRCGFLAQLQPRSQRSVPDAEPLGYQTQTIALRFHLQNAVTVHDKNDPRTSIDTFNSEFATSVNVGLPQFGIRAIAFCRQMSRFDHTTLKRELHTGSCAPTSVLSAL